MSRNPYAALASFQKYSQFPNVNVTDPVALEVIEALAAEMALMQAVIDADVIVKNDYEQRLEASEEQLESYREGNAEDVFEEHADLDEAIMQTLEAAGEESLTLAGVSDAALGDTSDRSIQIVETRLADLKAAGLVGVTPLYWATSSLADSAHPGICCECATAIAENDAAEELLS